VVEFDKINEKIIMKTKLLTICLLLVTSQVFAEGVWSPTDKPNCLVWDPAPRDEQTVTWSGECESGKAHGKGLLTWNFKTSGKPQTQLNKGELKNGRTFGRFKYTFETGDIYVGDVDENGDMHGRGTLTFAEGDEYIGQWKINMFHGRGTFTLTDGTKYVGEWKEDKMHGRGTLTYADGTKEVGQFKDDKYVGK